MVKDQHFPLSLFPFLHSPKKSLQKTLELSCWQNTHSRDHSTHREMPAQHTHSSPWVAPPALPVQPRRWRLTEVGPVHRDMLTALNLA